MTQLRRQKRDQVKTGQTDAVWSTRVFRIMKSQIRFIFDLKGRLETWQRAIWGHNYKLWASGIQKEGMRR